MCVRFCLEGRLDKAFKKENAETACSFYNRDYLSFSGYWAIII